MSLTGQSHPAAFPRPQRVWRAAGTDLVFTAALTDPIEPYRDTRLKLYVENNGKTLYTTDPNYGFQALRLNQNQPVTLDGFALQPYLQPEASSVRRAKAKARSSFPKD